MLADGSLWLRGQTAHALTFSHRLFAGEHDRPRCIPREAFGGHCAVVVACGKRHTLVLSADGRAWTAGCNLYAQLGYTAAGHREHFACVAGNGLAEACLVAAACGDVHNAVLDARGRVYTWGGADSTCLGRECERSKHVPCALSDSAFCGDSVHSLAAGPTHTVALGTRGRPWVWGIGGALGTGDWIPRVRPAQLHASAFDGAHVAAAACGRRHTLYLDAAGMVWTTDSERFVPVCLGSAVLGGERAVAIAACRDLSAVVTRGGLLYTWGLKGLPMSLDGRFRYEVARFPTRADPVLFAGARLGSTRWLSEAERTALAMALHPRLGADSAMHDLDTDILALVLRMLETPPSTDQRSSTRIQRP